MGGGSDYECFLNIGQQFLLLLDGQYKAVSCSELCLKNIALPALRRVYCGVWRSLGSYSNSSGSR